MSSRSGMAGPLAAGGAASSRGGAGRSGAGGSRKRKTHASTRRLDRDRVGRGFQDMEHLEHLEDTLFKMVHQKFFNSFADDCDDDAW